MIARLRRWIRGDGAAEKRIKVLEGQVAASEMYGAAVRAVYLRRLEVCGDCPTCRPEPMNFDQVDYEFGEGR